MPNSRFSILNRAESATLKNGTGGGAPALDQVSPYTMANAQTADRRTPWQSSSGAASFDYDLDLGASRTISVAALLGLRMVTSESSGTLEVSYTSSYPGGPWTSIGTQTWASGARDVGIVLSNTAAGRYWRFTITPDTTQNIVVGRVWLGNYTNYDLGGMHSPGGISSPFQNRIEQALEDGSVNINTLGFPGRDFTLPFNTASETLRDQLTAVAATSGTVVYIDPEDDVYEVYVRQGRAQVARSGNALFAATLEMARLP